MHLQIGTPKLSRKNGVWGLYFSCMFSVLMEITQAENITDKQLFPLLLISVFFGFTICDSQNTEPEGIWTHSRTQHRW